MKYIRLYLKGFKPLIYGGTKQIELVDMSQIVILSGENGKGKSSILRELTPYPACRTDYEKHGLKVIEIQHRNSYYVLTSDFSKTNGAHSFKKDDVELNISGTTEVQTDLVNQYFDGFTPIVEKLTSGQCKFSQLSRPERNKVIMATYPSPMLFVLEKYKTLMSKIRGCNSSIKELNERKLKIKESYIDDSTLKHHNDLKKLMNEAMSALDQDIFMIEQLIKPYREHELFDYKSDVEPSQFVYHCKILMNRITLVYQECIKQNMDVPNGDKIKTSLEVIKLLVKNLQEKLDDNKERTISIRDEVDKYRNYLSTDREKVIKDCEQMIETQKAIIREHDKEDHIPYVDMEECKKMQEYASTLQEQLQVLQSMNLEHWSEEQTITKIREVHEIEMEIRNLQVQLNNITAEMKKLKFRKQQYTKNPYPESCKTPCPLRNSIENIIKNIDMEFNSNKESGQKIYDRLKLLTKKLDELKKALEDRSPARGIINNLERLIPNKTWGDFVLSNEFLINVLNTNITDIWNRYLRVIKKSESVDKVRKAKDMLVTLEAKLTGLKAENQPVKQIISETLIKKENEMKKLDEERKTLLNQCYLAEVTLQNYDQYKSILDQAVRLYETWQKYKIHQELITDVKFCEEIIIEMQQTKSQISEKLRDLDNIIHEQESLRIRLHEEIEPAIKSLQDRLRKWQAIEKQLSPTKGIPNKLLVRYITEIFTKANQFIRRVWNYDMELICPKVGEDLDFTFPVRINDDGIVKDISICSKGQKEIIDLAIIIGICTYRKYAGMYPLKLDEMTSGLSGEHSAKLFDYLGELFHQSNILQAFIVNHDPVMTTSYQDASYAVLSKDYPLPAACKVITKLN